MPRKARLKRHDAIYHIMCRSLPEIKLFKNDKDKEYYIKLIARYIDKYKCSLYAFCVMNNHVHMHMDTKGYDISKFMHSLNTAYAIYYNKKYNRYGSVFQGRFKSKILNTDNYNLAVSAYIHNNAKDIEGYKNKEEEYPYSSYGTYLGITDKFDYLIDMSFILELFHTKNKNYLRKSYA